ncbi:hypothetical protein N752_25320 [Desulforamulus aquiferis]|nr:hypothetical protein [Desulforamulus aquiferis]RYD02645.1 hypothetical protein N752_25320 [Desulforamulus aquiferis]
MKFINLNNLGKWVITLAVALSFMFGTLVENRLQVVHNIKYAVENTSAVIIIPAGNKIKERFDSYYKQADKAYNALKIGTAISLAL